MPGILVDHVVVGRPENHMQTMGTQYNRAFAGDIRVPVGSLRRLPLDERKIIARRAAVELGHGAIVNLGIGVPAGIASIAAEEGVRDLMALTWRPARSAASPPTGSTSPTPATPTPPSTRATSSTLRRRRPRRGLPRPRPDRRPWQRERVQVQRPAGGMRGFINITQNAKKVVFCGAFTAGGLEIRAADGRLEIVREGTSRKFLDHVEQITFSGHYAAGVGADGDVRDRARGVPAHPRGRHGAARGGARHRHRARHPRPLHGLRAAHGARARDGPGIFSARWGRLYEILHS